MAYDEFMRGMKMTASDMMGSGPMSDRESALNRRATDSYMKAMSQLMAQNQPPMGGGQTSDQELEAYRRAIGGGGQTSDQEMQQMQPTQPMGSGQSSTTDLTNFIINLGIKLRGGR
jgi:hypothetical protein